MARERQLDGRGHSLIGCPLARMTIPFPANRFFARGRWSIAVRRPGRIEPMFRQCMSRLRRSARFAHGLAVFVFGCIAVAAAGAADVRRESEVKAVLLYNFTQFVEWPAEAFEAPDSPLIIGVLGPDPFGRALDTTVEGEMVDGHRIEVARFREVEEAVGCHLLFISSSERAASGEILERLQGRPILTVAEFDSFLERGGIVQLHRGPNNKVRLRVNLAAARAASLTLSAKLLRVAETVSP